MALRQFAGLRDDSGRELSQLTASPSGYDGGETWTRIDFPAERCIDPWLAMMPNGELLFTGIELLQDEEGDKRFHLVSFRSEDGGRIWSSRPTSLGRLHEHAMLFVHRSPDCESDCNTDPRAMMSHQGTVYLTSRRMRRTADGHPRHTVYVATARV